MEPKRFITVPAALFANAKDLSMNGDPVFSFTTTLAIINGELKECSWESMDANATDISYCYDTYNFTLPEDEDECCDFFSLAIEDNKYRFYSHISSELVYYDTIEEAAANYVIDHNANLI